MEINDKSDVGRWVNDRVGAVTRDDPWEPDVEQGLARLQAGRARRARIGPRMAVVMAVGTVLSLTPPAWPITRLVAARCVDACVGVSNRVGQLFTSDTAKGSASTVPAVSARAVEGVVPEALRVAAPDFALDDSTGHRVRLSTLRGHVVVLNFWATWCGPCRLEMPAFSELQETYANDGLAIIGLSLDEDGWTSVRPFLKEKGVSYPIVIADDTISRDFGAIDALPTSVIVDRLGRIAVRHVGLVSKADYERELRTLLGKTESPR